MPAVYAHYKFGKEVYRALPKNIREIIRENKPAYFIGLHGPDTLFYYRSFCKNRINQLGTRMHREEARAFFEKARTVYQERPSYVLLSYLCGFMCHFMLDSECHPYIGEYMERFDAGHLEIETDFDRDLMEKDGLDPTRYCCTHHLVQDYDTNRAIASVLENVTPAQVSECIIGFHNSIRIFQCPTAVKARFLKTVSHITGQDKELGGLISDGTVNPKCKESREELTRRLYAAVAPTAVQICRLVEGINGDEPLSERLNRNFE